MYNDIYDNGYVGGVFTADRRKAVDVQMRLIAGLKGKYILSETVFCAAEIVFGLLSSCLALTALGVYSAVGVFCVSSYAAQGRKNVKVLSSVFVFLLFIAAAFSAWFSFYRTMLTIGYAEGVSEFWGVIPAVLLFFAKALIYMAYKDNEEIASDPVLYGGLIDYSYDFLLIFSTAVCIPAAFVWDFYAEYAVALGISLCCFRRLWLLYTALRGKSARKEKTETI